MDASLYRCPYDRLALAVWGDTLVCPSHHAYLIVDGTPHLIDLDREGMGRREADERAFYEALGPGYDDVMAWLFESFGEDGAPFRRRFADTLRLGSSSRVLDVGGGTGHDSVAFAERLGPDGLLVLQDLSPAMLAVGKRRVEAALDRRPDAPCFETFVGSVAHLPFEDHAFDAVFHFGAFAVFSDRTAALAEMVRVAKVGGRVAFGDEGMAPWLRDTEYGRILTNSHPLYAYEPELDLLPESARDVEMRWMLGNAFWLCSFTKGEGPPYVDLDKPILGSRGGTHRTRWYGRLEGVTSDTKRAAEEAAARAGVSLHDWLDRVVREAADA